MTTPILALSELTESQATKYITVNTALRHIEGRTVRVLSKSTTAPPGSPADGDSYIIPSGATGVWSGKTNQIALLIGGAWSYYVPIEGVTVWVNDLNLLYSFDGSAWVTSAGAGSVTSVGLSLPAEFTVSGSPVTTSGTLSATKANQSANQVYAGPSSGGAAAPAFRALVAADIPSQPYDVGAFLESAPTASQIMLRVPFSRQVIFAAGLSPSRGIAGTAATAQTDFDIQKEGSSVGTMRFAASGTVASFIMASQTTFAAGDKLTVIAPATPDATLAKVAFILSGTR